MKLYWVSAIIQNKTDSKPWLLAINEGVLTLEEAMEIINFIKSNHTALSVWVDVFGENNIKEIVFHKCYINNL